MYDRILPVRKFPQCRFCTRIAGAQQRIGMAIPLQPLRRPVRHGTEHRDGSVLALHHQIGKDTAVALFGPVPDWPPERLERYRHAYTLLSAGDPGAESALRELADGQDPIIHLYLQRLATGRLGTRIVLEEK